MSRIIAIHQPNFIPWIGFFYKWMVADIFVMLDDVQFSNNSLINRNKIKTSQGEQWITVPVMRRGRFRQQINETRILRDPKWIKKCLGSLKMNYSNSPFFSKYYPKIQELISQNQERLVELNISLLKWIVNEISIDVPFLRSSELKCISGNSTERLVSICKALGADKYYCGFGGNKYHNEDLFKEMQIQLIKTDFLHPTYPQSWGRFIPNLSVLDLMFNCGDESKKYILKQK